MQYPLCSVIYLSEVRHMYMKPVELYPAPLLKAIHTTRCTALKPFSQYSDTQNGLQRPSHEAIVD